MKKIISILLLAFTFSAAAQTKKISELTATTSADTNALLEISQPSGTNFVSRKITVDNLFAQNAQSKILYVSKTGSDTYGERGRPDKPFATFYVTQTNAIAGDLIVVLPGDYSNTNSLGKSNVNWFFFPGASVESSARLWNDGGSNMSFTVSGYGDFTATNGFATFSGNSTVNFEAQSITLGPPTGFFLENTNASLSLLIRDEVAALGGEVFYGEGTFDLNGKKISGTGRLFEDEGSSLIVKCAVRELEGGSTPIRNNGTSDYVFTGSKISSTLPIQTADGGTITLVNCTIDSTNQNITSGAGLVTAINTVKLDGTSLGTNVTVLPAWPFTDFNTDQFHLEGTTLTAGAEIGPHYFNVTNLNAFYLLARPQDESGDIAIFSDFGGAGRSYIRPDGTFEGPHRVIGAGGSALDEGTALIDASGNIYSSGGGLKASQVVTTTNLTLTTNMTFIGADTTSGAVELTLPTVQAGQIFYIKKTGNGNSAHALRIIAAGGEFLEGDQSQIELKGGWSSRVIIGAPDASTWWIF